MGPQTGLRTDQPSRDGPFCISVSSGFSTLWSRVGFLIATIPITKGYDMTNQPDRTIGVALSGGGHRATVFGLGALLALCDHELNHQVTSISSVSGGSIANGIAMVDLDYGTTTAEAFEAHLAPRLSAIANRGLLLDNAPATTRYVRCLFGAAGVAIVALLAFVAGALLRWRVAVITALVVFILSLLALWMLARKRSERTEQAADSELLGNANVTLSSLVSRSVHHVICTTELQSGEPFYLSPRMVHGYHFGHGKPGGVRLSTAVQASACVPGAFNPRVIATDDMAMSLESGLNQVILNDGGTYDNMADQWEYGFAGRATNDRSPWPGLTALQAPAKLLLIVNASKGWDNLKPIALGGRALELAGLIRSQGVQYDGTTAHRRQALYRDFVAAETTGVGLRGCFAQIGRSPFRPIQDFAFWKGEGEPDATWRLRHARAQAAAAFLDAQGYTQKAYDQTADANAGVKTTLARLNGKAAEGRNVTAELLEHGYLSTIINLHVVHGLLPLTAFDKERFSRLCR